MPQEAASGLWRSEDMVCLDVVLPRDQLRAALFAVGQAACAEFVDLSPATQAFGRPFAADVRRCEEFERRLRFLRDSMRQAGVEPVETAPEVPSGDDCGGSALLFLERALDDHEAELRRHTEALQQLTAQSNALRRVLEVAARDLGVDGYAGDGETRRPFATIGVIPEANVSNFQRLLYRASRGNAYVRVDPITEPFVDTEGVSARHCVFVAVAPSAVLRTKLTRIAETQGARTVDPLETRPAEVASARARMARLDDTIAETNAYRRRVLLAVAASWVHWQATVQAEKAAYSVMNLLDCSGPVVRATAWVPTASRGIFERALAKGHADGVTPVVAPNVAPGTPPTYFRTNEVTGAFQGIVDSYGVARYKEVNPGVLTIVTFPYLFGVMYGDVGHGLMMTIAVGAVLLMEGRLKAQRSMNEIFAMAFGGRYLLFFMALFATYIGLLYNDCFGMSLEVFPSAYKWPAMPQDGGPAGIVHPVSPAGQPSVKPVAPVAFGIDASWAETDNKLEFYNSVKMKCAVILGVIQMMTGLFLSLMNHVRRRDWRKVLFGFIPEAVFLGCTFGYMALLIIYKWVTPWDNTNLAPSLLETMTNFFLAPGLVLVPLYPGQAAVQLLLLTVAFLQVPVMLCVIPYLELRDHKARQRRNRGETYEDVEMGGLVEGQPEAEAEAGVKGFDFGEVMIHYVIHTIEFVLGCVSNTASYLRLWALSLAHAQLSEVFLNFSLIGAIGADSGNGLSVMVGSAIWLAATILVLLMMESLSAFLHALRLHWVEFQGKFYAGDGIPFAPFDLVAAARV